MKKTIINVLFGLGAFTAFADENLIVEDVGAPQIAGHYVMKDAMNLHHYCQSLGYQGAFSYVDQMRIYRGNPGTTVGIEKVLAAYPVIFKTGTVEQANRFVTFQTIGSNGYGWVYAATQLSCYRGDQTGLLTPVQTGHLRSYQEN